MPLIRVETEGFEGTFLADNFDLVDDFVATIVATSGETFTVLVSEVGTESFHDGTTGKIFTGDQFESSKLSHTFLTN